MTDWSVALHRGDGVDDAVCRTVAEFLADRDDSETPVEAALDDAPPLDLTLSVAHADPVGVSLRVEDGTWLRVVPTAGADAPEAALALLGRCIELFERFDFDLGVVLPADATLPTEPTPLPTDPAGLAGDDGISEGATALLLGGDGAEDVGRERLAATSAVAALELLDGSVLLLGGPDLAGDRLSLSEPAAPDPGSLPLRDAVSWALGWLDTSAVADRLTALLEADRVETRVAATETLGLLRRTDTRAALATALDDPEPAVRAAAVDALSGVDEAPVERLRTLAREDPDEDVRAAAARALERHEAE
jgi:hypothetical protein